MSRSGYKTAWRKALFLFIATPALITLPEISVLNASSESLCPDWLFERAGSLPACPRSNPLPDNFPTGFLVISDAFDIAAGLYQDPNYVSSIVLRALRAGGETPPMILMQTRRVVFDTVTELIKEDRELDRTRKELWLRYVRHMGDRMNYPWMQDFFQVATDTSGVITLRFIKKYDKYKDLGAGGSLRDDFSEFAKSLQACGINVGAAISWAKGAAVGPAGGNIEGLPGNLCLIGTQQLDSKQGARIQAETACGPKEVNWVQVPVDWLEVGHIDEIVKVLPFPASHEPCNFSVMIADVDVAIRIMKESRKEKFFEGSHSPGYFPLDSLCQEALRGAECATVNNGDVLDLLEERSSAVSQVNELARKYLRITENIVTSRLSARLNCKVDVIRVPYVFNKLGDYLRAASVLPNTTNSIVIGDTLIMPDPGNAGFRSHITRELNRRGIRTDFVTTFDESHIWGGDLHCRTQTIPLCRSH